MKHARPDYNRIQDPENKIPQDEPVFVIRGQDKAGAAAVRAWAAINKAVGGDPYLSKLAIEHADLMDSWHKKKTSDYKNRDTIPCEPFFDCNEMLEKIADDVCALFQTEPHSHGGVSLSIGPVYMNSQFQPSVVDGIKRYVRNTIFGRTTQTCTDIKSKSASCTRITKADLEDISV